jgi:hypothetical protein
MIPSLYEKFPTDGNILKILQKDIDRKSLMSITHTDDVFHSLGIEELACLYIA